MTDAMRLDGDFADSAEAFNSFDPEGIARFYHCPCLMVASGVVCRPHMRTAGEAGSPFSTTGR
jgi:hypothetical protein